MNELTIKLEFALTMHYYAEPSFFLYKDFNANKKEMEGEEHLMWVKKGG